jgi:hypothetical protein
MPVEFDQLKTEELLRSIDLMLLQKDILSHFSSAVENDAGFFYRPLVFKSATGKPDRMVVRVVVKSSKGWRRKGELENHHAKYLRTQVEGPNNASQPTQ